MTTPWDGFIDSLEQKKRQLDDVLEAYRIFQEKLHSLPPELAQEAAEAFGSNKPEDAHRPIDRMMDCIGKPALACAKMILADHGNTALHFTAIAKEALARGYQGRARGTEEEIQSRTINSFWAAMSRSKELETKGRGCYRLKAWPQVPGTTEKSTENF